MNVPKAVKCTCSVGLGNRKVSEPGWSAICVRRVSRPQPAMPSKIAAARRPRRIVVFLHMIGFDHSS
jgi:hypothetical protein